MINYRNPIHLILSITLPFLLIACSGGEETSTSDIKVKTETAKATGNVKYMANFKGEPPERSEADASGNPECGVDTVKGQDIVVNDNQTLRDVVISFAKGPSSLEEPAEETVIDQENCQYRPHVTTVKAGQKVKVTDSDPDMHNVRATNEDGRQLFNLTTFKGDEKEVTFDEPGYVKLECNIHPWMEAWVYVTEHGKAEVVGSDGKASLKNLPTGDYTFQTWHEELNNTKHSESITKDKTLSIQDTFRAD